ncbi:7-cyano-7-deazaguanine synthase [Lysinibacillus xylanilyticus]|uniref:7-cyano-7-deazaguanine synthase n=1 Tax=Lysinibacillus xylanilyticus TaxID=582475 RepID=UPI00380B7EA4
MGIRKSNTVLVLASGGIDSAAVIKYYLSKNYMVSVLFYNYQQATKDKELKAIQSICDYYEVKLTKISLGFSLKNIKGEYVGRNALFLTIALSFLPSSYSRVAMGIHSGTPYYDCSETFLLDYQEILDGYFGGTVLFEAPFLHFTKEQIIDFCMTENVPINLTYSCERGSEEICNECPSCIDRSVYLGKYDLM